MAKQKFVVHCKRAHYDVLVDRTTIWGNPFTWKFKDGIDPKFIVKNRDEAIGKFRTWILTQPDLVAQLPKLRGKILGCWCAPSRCHGDVLAELANYI